MENLMPIYIAAGVLVVAVIALIVVMIIIKKKKDPLKGNGEEFVDELLGYYGGIENIKSVHTDNGRLKIEVNDLDVVKLDMIKSLAENGVFVTGNTVKTLYRVNSDKIKKIIDGRLK